MPSPTDEYCARLERRRAELDRLNRLDARFAGARLAVFALAVVLLVLAVRDAVPFYALIAPVLVFVLLLRRHDTTIRARDCTARAIAFYERGLARLEDRWAGSGESGERFRDDHHVYANDLDLFGGASLFQLLSTARTQPGEETLASWLKAGASSEEVLARQAAVRELATALDLREALAAAGTGARPGTPRESLVAWAQARAVLTPPSLWWVVIGLSAVSVTTLLLSNVIGTLVPAIVVLLIQGAVAVPFRHRLEVALRGTEAAAHDLDILAHLLERLERETFATPKLALLGRRLKTAGRTASGAIRALDWLVEMHDWHHNPYFRLLTLPLMWRLQMAFAIERWRRQHGHDVALWIQTVAEFEALSSLAAYSYEHPADPFPEIAPSGQGPAVARFEGAALGHPLLPAADAVRNDVRLDERTRLLVVSGSNMSGKSTLLRTVGINAVLGLAGAPVRAGSLRLSPLMIGATLRIQDSLQEGRSRFYAEITRIREIADLARSGPLLFLLDELFHGTNSHDRLVGASGVLRSLLDRGSIGLITTHDLALTAIADELAPRAENIHFEDTFDGTDIRFDYLAKPGRVTRSNALALMRAVGLDVGPA